MTVSILAKTSLSFAALVCAIAVPAAAQAATTISSNATGVSGSLQISSLLPPVLPSVSATIGAVSTVSGTAAPAYSKSNTVASANQSLNLGAVSSSPLSQGVSTGVVTTSASSTFPVSPTGRATATVNDLDLSLLLDRAILADVNFLSLAASTITSTTSFDGTAFAGFSSVAGLGLASEILPLSLGAALTANPLANTTLIDVLGLRVVLNEQLSTNVTADGLFTQSFTTNALHLVYDNFAVGTRVLNGNIIIGQRQVAVSTAVPEASTWAMMVLGFGVIGGALRTTKRRNRLSRAIV